MKFLFLAWLAVQVTGDVLAPAYTAFDDYSWAITHTTLSNQLGDKQTIYDEFIKNCNLVVLKKGTGLSCEEDDANRIRMNTLQPSSVYNYTKFGYEKIKAPKELFALIKDFWDKNRDKSEIEYSSLNTFHNIWETPPTIVHMNQPRSGGSSELQTKVWDSTREVLEEWSGQLLSPVSLYGIRSYHNGSILAPHVDRMPLVISCIINVDQDVDEAWPLEVYGHDGRATNVTMEPGDMVLYESHSVIHGRPFPMKGNFYANIFAHFEPIEAHPGIDASTHIEKDIPPYIIPGSPWEYEWKKDNQGWAAKYSDPHDAAKKGDVSVLKRLAQVSSTALHQIDKGGWMPLHEAVRAGHHDAVQLIILNGGDVNYVTPQGHSSLALAREHLTEDHPVIQLLLSVGAVHLGPEL